MFAKESKEGSHYVERPGPATRYAQRCGNCVHKRPGSVCPHCAVVEGCIRTQDWCALWKKG